MNFTSSRSLISPVSFDLDSFTLSLLGYNSVMFYLRLKVYAITVNACVKVSLPLEMIMTIRITNNKLSAVRLIIVRLSEVKD